MNRIPGRHGMALVAAVLTLGLGSGVAASEITSVVQDETRAELR